jgi:hypothetical protein
LAAQAKRLLSRGWCWQRRAAFIGHGDGDVLLFALGQNMLLLSNPLLGDFHATRAAASAVTPLTDVFGVRTVNRSATLPGNAHGTGLAGEHPINDLFGLLADDIAVFSASLAPAIILSRFDSEWGFANEKKRHIQLSTVC